MIRLRSLMIVVFMLSIGATVKSQTANGSSASSGGLVPSNNSTYPESSLNPPPAVNNENSPLEGSGGGEMTTFDDPGLPGDGSGDTPDQETVPIDGGVTILLAIGIGLGIKSYRNRKQINNLPNTLALS